VTDFRGRLNTVEEMQQFTLAGNATLTLVSEKTGTRYTYKVRQCVEDEERKELWFVSVMYGPDNEDDFTYIGIIRPNGFAHGRKSSVPATDIRVKGFEWFWQMVSHGKPPANLVVWHEGRCCRCGRKLTVPESVQDGIGPECRKHVQPFQRSLNLEAA
jgi:Family of unknown function (DUF6011)